MDEQFWLNDPEILYKNTNFNLLSLGTLSTKLNILTRFIIIVCVLLYLVNNNNNIYFIIGLISIIIIIIINKMCNKEKFTELNELNELTELQKSYNEIMKPQRESDYFSNASDSNNPLKNISIPEYDTKPDYSDSSKSTDLNKFINNKLFQTESDYLFDKEARQFYTMPNNKKPNEQGKFANWLYGTTDNCKSDSIYAHRLGHTIENKNCDTALNVSVPTNEGQIN